MNRPSKYSDTFDYDHRFHAGNVGDVLKHFALRVWARSLQSNGALHFVDTHAGAGMFKLPAQGEWQEGIGRLDARSIDQAPASIVDFITAVGTTRTPGKGGLYPGSPALFRSLLRPEDRLTVCELMEAPAGKLSTHYAEDAQVEVHRGDGLAALVEAARGSDDAQLAAFIDPPYVSKGEWQTVADAIIAAKSARPSACVCLWYPIKSLTRPQALRATLREAGIAGASIDLISTPLRLKKKRLNGSGLLIVDPPNSVLTTLATALPWLGDTLASGLEWTASVTRWKSA